MNRLIAPNTKAQSKTHAAQSCPDTYWHVAQCPSRSPSPSTVHTLISRETQKVKIKPLRFFYFSLVFCRRSVSLAGRWPSLSVLFLSLSLSLSVSLSLSLSLSLVLHRHGITRASTVSCAPVSLCSVCRHKKVKVKGIQLFLCRQIHTLTHKDTEGQTHTHTHTHTQKHTHTHTQKH